VRPQPVQRLAAQLAAQLEPYAVEMVCGPLVGGAFIAQMVAEALNVEFCYSERFVQPERNTLFPVQYLVPGGLRKNVEGKRAAILDDAISAGSAVRGTLADLLVWGAKPVVVGALLVIGSISSSFFASQNMPLENLTEVSSNLWEPSQCPLCASNTPLEDIGAGGAKPASPVTS